MHWGSLPIRKETTNYSIHFYIYTAMANHKIYYLLLFFLLPFSFLGAQNGVADQLLKATFHPSPQSAAYARYGEYPVDHSTGVPKIEIPIYTHSFTVFTSLSFSSLTFPMQNIRDESEKYPL